MSLSAHVRRAYGRAIVLTIFFVGAMTPQSLFAANGSVAYSYDALGRITATSYDTGVCISYSYDANGNRLSERIIVVAPGSTGIWGCFNWNNAKWGP